MKRENFKIINANLVDVENKKIIPNSTVYVRDGLISKEFEDVDTVYDASDCYLVPGLINIHAHLFGSGKPSNAVNGKGDSQAKLMNFVKTKLGNLVVNMLVKGSLKTNILAGTTTLRAVGDIGYSDVNQRNKINEGKYLGPRVLASGPAITCISGHGDGTISEHYTTKEEYESAVAERKAKGCDFIKIMVTSGVMDAKSESEPDLMMGVEETKWVCDKAHELGMKVAAHVESKEGVRTALKGGVDTIEHGGAFDEEIVELFKKNGSSLTTTISPALPFAEFDSEITHCTEVQTRVAKYVSDNIIQGNKDAQKYGVTYGLGTDAGCPFAFQYGMWRELQYVHKYCGVANEEALKVATIGNAKILGLDNITGSIEVGKSADMFLIHENPFENLRALSKPIVVFKEGYAIKNPKIKRFEELDQMIDKLSD